MDTAHLTAVNDKVNGNTIPLTFRYCRKKYDVLISFAKITGYCNIEPYDRQSVEVVFKQHNTGRPYAGIAILSPGDVDNINYALAIKTAMRRALDSMMIGEFRHDKSNAAWMFDFENENNIVKGMMDAFRSELFYIVNDEETIKHVESIRATKKANALRERARIESQKTIKHSEKKPASFRNRILKLLNVMLSKKNTGDSVHAAASPPVEQETVSYDDSDKSES